MQTWCPAVIAFTEDQLRIMIGKIVDCLATVLLVACIDLKTGFWTLYARAHASCVVIYICQQRPAQYAIFIIKQRFEKLTFARC